jgi:hypothetical protein
MSTKARACFYGQESVVRRIDSNRPRFGFSSAVCFFASHYVEGSVLLLFRALCSLMWKSFCQSSYPRRLPSIRSKPSFHPALPAVF